MSGAIKQARLVISAGGGPEYDVTPGNPNSSTFDIGDRLGADPSWRCVAAWWHVSDAIEALPNFHQIDVAPKREGNDLSDVDLTVKAWSAGQIQIAVTAIYEFDVE